MFIIITHGIIESKTRLQSCKAIPNPGSNSNANADEDKIIRVHIQILLVPLPAILEVAALR